MHSRSEVDISALVLDSVEALLPQSLGHHISNRISKCFLLFADSPPHFEDYTLFASPDVFQVVLSHPLHSVQHFSFSFFAGTVCFTHLSLMLGFDNNMILSCILNCQIEIITFSLSLFDLFKSFSSAVVAKELQEHSVNLFLVPLSVMFN